MRIGLGCMRLDDATGRTTIERARTLGVTLFDTARAYGNEHLLAGISGRIVTKCGMARPEGKWVPDGRATSVLADARASFATLGRIDTLLLHAPDPRTALETSVRALVRARDEGLTRAIGLSNVTRTQLIDAEKVARIETVQVALGAFDDAAARGGLLSYCLERGIEVQAHSPFGGPKKAPRLKAIANEAGLSAHELVLAFLLSLGVTPIVGTTHHLESLVRADGAILDARIDLAALFPGLMPAPPAPTVSDREVVMLVGIAGAGKSTAAASLGLERLNRDERGGTLKQIAAELDRRLAEGARQLVLDNTYLTRASRQLVIAIAHKHGARVRCIYYDTPLPQAQINVVLRMLEKYGRLLEPEEIVEYSKKDENLVRPTVLFRMVRELEVPSLDEGFAEIDVVPFVRRPRGSHAATLVVGECTHPRDGPPICWCRPPLPGLLLAHAREHDIDLSRSTLFATSPAHEQMARALGITVAR